MTRTRRKNLVRLIFLVPERVLVLIRSLVLELLPVLGAVLVLR